MLTMLGSWRRFLALALVGVLTASLGAVMTRSAEAANTAPAEILLGSITSAITAPVEPPAAPTVLALAAGDLPPSGLLDGMLLTLKVSFRDSLGVPASFTKDTRLVVTSDRGTVTSIDTVARKGAKISFLTVSIPAPANQVKLTVKLPGGKRPLSAIATDDQRFDVLSQLRSVPQRTGFQEGIGGERNCAQATPTTPVCGIVYLPQGARATSQILLSLGPCAPIGPPDVPYEDTYSGCGDPRGSVMQVLADMPLATPTTPDGYSRTSPATMLVKCDKTLCGGGSIHSQVLNFTRGGNAALVALNPCPAKGVVGEQQELTGCVDYVQSKRDGSGDTYLYLLFVQDARVSVS